MQPMWRMVLCGLMCLWAGHAQASSLSAADTTALRTALSAASTGEISTANMAAAPISDPVARQLVEWRIADAAGYKLTFSTLNGRIEQFADWPGVKAMRTEAERKMPLARLAPQDVIRWFAHTPPTTGEGILVYAEALQDQKRVSEAAALIRRAWRERAMTPAWQTEAYDRFSPYLTAADTRARAQMLVASSATSVLEDLSRQLASDDLAVVRAVRALKAGQDEGAALAGLTPAQLRDAAIAHERALRLRKAERHRDAAAVLVHAEAPLSEAVAERVWASRVVLARRMMDSGEANIAYLLASQHGMSSGKDHAQAEWMAGWIALDRLKDPKRAERHFAALEATGTTPVTKARAQYWQGRALERAGDSKQARLRFQQAAAWNTTYYGQLAAEALGQRELRLPPPTRADPAALDRLPVARAARLLAEMGDDALFSRFALHLNTQLRDREQRAALSVLALSLGRPAVATRLGKATAAAGEPVHDLGYPLRAIPEAQLGGHKVEPAFALALMRQESEFDPKARSHADARGMMQMLPATARSTARRIGVSFDEARLYDADYNVNLGTHHLAELLAEFNGSYILTAAAYNAGTMRAWDWMAKYGDPRGQIDPVLFVESIPFEETRNYVMRVLEATQIYRARLGGGATNLQISEDLRRGQR